MTGYILTRIDIAALLKADRMVVHYNGGNVTESRIYAVKQKRPSETDPFATDVTYNLSIPIDITGYGYNGLHSTYLEPEQKLKIKAFAMTNFYHGQCTEESTIIRMLRAGDDVRLEFCASCNNGHLDQNGLHHDKLFLHVNRGRNRFTFLLDDSIGPDNSARMIKGLPMRTTEQIGNAVPANLATDLVSPSLPD